MRFLEPKNKNVKAVDWEISEQTREIVRQYAEYAERTESETVDEFLLNILDDKKFIEWVTNKRSNKRIVRRMGLEDKADRSQ
ncbi:hypothetical protein GLW08_07510 [Pontibacillus yanchengensis]|uniref:Uncharacterized protein n=1 Tax=Pontibacillus yanchengensis TaxID=462910 RepID=A0ACC7VGX9_9BACI|nr:hypothetical protein [Pontibacillus yanchengensis]MYL53184.1 hypothetical protein [Pontibacillus yanchengensis]